MSLYDVLGVEPDATHDELRAAFRMRLRALHPDHNAQAESDHVAVTSLAEAWHILGDHTRRDAYDAAQTAPAPRPRPTPDSFVSPRLLRTAFVTFMLVVVVILVVLTLVAFSQSG